MSFKSTMNESPSWLVVPMISRRAPAWAAAAAAQATLVSHPGSRLRAAATSLADANLAAGSCASSLRSVTSRA